MASFILKSLATNDGIDRETLREGRHKVTQGGSSFLRPQYDDNPQNP